MPKPTKGPRLGGSSSHQKAILANLAASLFERFSSRGEGTYANKVLSAMRRQFGGHAEKPEA